MTRPATPTDIPALKARGVQADPLDAGKLRAIVADTGASDGYALFAVPQAGIPYMGEVYTRVENRRLFYQLILGVAEALLADGYKRGYAWSSDKRMADLLRRDHGKVITTTEHGTNLDTGSVGEYRFEVDLAEFIAALERFR